MTPLAPTLPVLPERIRQARENSRLRSALLKDRDLFRHFASTCCTRRPGQAHLMLERVKELDEVLTNHNPAAPAARSDRPTGAGAAESTR